MAGAMQEIWLDSPYGKVFGQQTGPLAGPVVLGLHGWSQRNGWHTWQPLMQPLAEVGCRVVCVDMPGWGQSRPGPGTPLTTAQAVTTVHALLDSLQATTAVLLGKSWGGGVAITLALDDPGRVRKLILTAPAFRQPERLPQVTQPVLLAWAEDDPVIPFAYAQIFAGALPHCQLVTYPAGGHSAAQKNAADFAPKAVAFLRES